MLKNSIIQGADAGFFLNGAFYGAEYELSPVLGSSVYLFPANDKVNGISIDLGTTTLLNKFGSDITPDTYEKKAEVLAKITSRYSDIGSILDPQPVRLDEVLSGDIDWEHSDFAGWTGNPKELFGYVGVNKGIYNDSTDNPKFFKLVFKRSRLLRVFGIGSGTGNFSNIRLKILGSNDTIRGDLNISPDPAKMTSLVYTNEQYTVNAMLVEFYTPDRVDITNLFLKNEYSTRKTDFIHKFGRNPEIDLLGHETVWTLGGLYIFTTTPQNYYISSSNSSDVEPVTVETIGINADGRYQREITTVPLQGQAKVLIPTNFLCVACNRAFNSNGQTLLGNVYIYEDTAIAGGVPVDLTKVRSHIIADRNQTEQAVYTVPEYLEDGRKVLFAEMYKWSGSALGKTGVNGIFDLVIAEKGKIGRIQSSSGMSDNYISGYEFGENTPLVVRSGSDVWVNCSAVTANDTTVEAKFLIKLVIL